MENKSPHWGVEVLIMILVMILCWEGYSLYWGFQHLGRSDAPSLRNQPSFIHHSLPLGVADIGYIQSWMTFDYINHLFNLPPDYLSANLKLSDVQYPRLSVSRYAGRHGLKIEELVASIKNAVRDYLTAKKP